MDPTLLLALHLTATAVMVGIIWFVQCVHYPLFDRVGPEGFADYEDQHSRRTSWVVGPPMGIEGVTALVLVAAPPDGLGRVLPLVGLALLAVVQGSTVWLQVPAHRRLRGGHDPVVTARLVATNWVRTVGWSARGVLAIAMLVVAVPS